jgi:hypothetical protein
MVSGVTAIPDVKGVLVMRNSRTVVAAVILTLAALLLVPTNASAAGRCSLAGTWIGQNDAGLNFLITFNPLDNAHKTFSSLADSPDDPAAFGVFPTATDGTAFQGTTRRTGRYTFEQTALAYQREGNAGWVGTFAVSGSWRLSKDCRTATVVWHASAFLPEDDPIGGVPFFCFPPITGVYHRVPVVASACEQ